MKSLKWIFAVMALAYAATSSFAMAAHGLTCAAHMTTAPAAGMQNDMAGHDAHAHHHHGATDEAPATPAHSDCGDGLCLCAAAGCGLAGIYTPGVVDFALFSVSGQFPLGDYAARGQDIDIPYPPPRFLV